MTSEAFFEKLNQMRANRRLITNSFLMKGEIETHLQKADTKVLFVEGLLLLMTDEPELSRVFYYSDGIDNLSKIGTLLEEESKPVVIDVVGRGDSPALQKSALLENGFELYSHFIRMSVKQPPCVINKSDEKVEWLNAEDAVLIPEILEKEFDPLFAHIPSVQEITEAVEKREIKAVYKNNEIAGITFFEKISPTMKCLRYFLVNPSYRGLGIGSALLADEFNNSDNKTQYYLWVGTYNKTINLYKKIGFAEDGLNDYIFKYKRRRNG